MVSDVPGPFAERLARVMASASFGHAVKRLERGVHICPDDGEVYYFVRQNFDVLATYFRTAFRSELVDREWFHLDGDPDYYGRRQLADGDVVTGTALALSFHSPERLRAGGVPIDEFVDGVRDLLGGDDAFVSVYRPRARASLSPQRRLESARDNCRRSVRRLARLGFARIKPGPIVTVEARETCHRFAEVVKLASDVSDEGLAAALEQLVAAGRLGPPAEGDRETEDEDDEV